MSGLIIVMSESLSATSLEHTMLCLSCMHNCNAQPAARPHYHLACAICLHAAAQLCLSALQYHP